MADLAKYVESFCLALIAYQMLAIFESLYHFLARNFLAVITYLPTFLTLKIRSFPCFQTILTSTSTCIKQ